MKFPLSISVKNIKRRPFRSFGMMLIIMTLTVVLFAGSYTVLSLKRGLSSYSARLGADIVVVPNSSKGHGSVDDILLQGITGNYYMSKKDCEKIEEIEGIEAISTQFFLTSAKASCCSTKVQIVGFDPDTDFSIMPWISESYSETIDDGDLIAGANIGVPADKTITFYGEEYKVAAQLGKTGTGLDSAVFVNMNTVKNMANSANNLLKLDAFKGVNIDTAASAIMIKVADGYEISEVTDDINIHITKVEATASKSMIADIADGLGNVSGIIGILIALVWVFALIILIVVFAMLSNERKKEFALLRAMGATKSMLFKIVGCETSLISFLGALVGLIISFFVLIPLSGEIKEKLSLPFFAPGADTLFVIAIVTLLIGVISALVTAFASAIRITGGETGMLLKEDA